MNCIEYVMKWCKVEQSGTDILKECGETDVYWRIQSFLGLQKQAYRACKVQGAAGRILCDDKGLG